MLTELKKIGLIPVFDPGLNQISKRMDILIKAGVCCAAFKPEDVANLQEVTKIPNLLVGVTAVSSLEQAKQMAALGVKFIALPGPSSGQAAWAQQVGLTCVPASQLPGGLSPVPAEVTREEKAFVDFVQQEIRSMLAFDLRHVGINCPDENVSSQTAHAFERIFGFPKEDRGGAYFAGEIIEVMKKPFYGQHGHIAISTRSAQSAAYYLEHNGVKLNWQSAGYMPDGRLRVVYLQEEIGGFAVHILQK